MMDRLARRLLAPVNTSVISIMGVFNVLLGFWLVLPFDSLNKYHQGYLELFIGVILLIIGSTILFGTIKEHLPVLSRGALVGFMFWITVTGLAIYVNWKGSDWIFTLMIAVYHGFVGVNLWVNLNNLPNKK
jgi:hypothetical protein